MVFCEEYIQSFAFVHALSEEYRFRFVIYFTNDVVVRVLQTAL